MNHLSLIVCASLGLVVLVLGIWLTVVGYEKSDKYSNKWMEDHKKQLKIAGPVLITVGSVISLFCLLKPKGKNVEYDNVTSNFGFKFY